MGSKKHYFGKFRDNSKEETMSFRISKETKDLFKTHAEKHYGGTANALKEIFLEYMSQYAFKRQTINKFVNIWIPRCDSEEDFHKYPLLPEREDMGVLIPPSQLDDLNNVIVESQYIDDVRGWDLDNEFVKTNYDDLDGWITKDSLYRLEDGIVITTPLNNQLDSYNEGIYGRIDFGDDTSSHHGISIVEFEGVVYYVIYTFEINPNENLYPVKMFSPLLVTNRDAFDYAMDCGNRDLAVLIDSFNDGTSNIEDDKQLLLDKRENLLHQLDEIDDKLSKF